MKKPRWIIGNEETQTNLWALSFYTPALLHDFARQSSHPVPHFFVFEGAHMRWWVNEQFTDRLSAILMARVKRQSAFLISVNHSLDAACRELDRFSRSRARINWRQYPSECLARELERHRDVVAQVYGWGLIPSFMEVLKPHVTNWCRQLISRRLRAPIGSESVTRVNDLLTTPTRVTAPMAETIALRRLVLRWRRLTGEKRRTAIIAHCQRFASAYYGYVGPSLSRRHVEATVRELLKDESGVRRQLALDQLKPTRLSRQRASVYRRYGFSRREQQYCDGLRRTVEGKAQRRDAISNSLLVMSPAISEAARRLNIKANLVGYLTCDELPRVVSGAMTVPANLLLREHFCLYDATEKMPRVLSGSSAKRLLALRYHPEIVRSVETIVGQTAQPGVVRGTVRIINQLSDISRMKKGNILLSVATSPDLVPAMRKAAGIVTERGGIISHAAIVSRELGIPCIIGTKFATRVLKDGDRVEVDATKGVVKLLKKK